MKKQKRRFRKFLVPVLGLAMLAPSAFPLAASAAAGTNAVKSVEFIGMSAPQTPADMARTYSKASVKVTYADGTVKSFPLSYEKLFKSTDVINGTPAGLAVDVNGKAIMDNSVPGKSTPFVSDDPDSNSLMKIDGAAPTGKGGNPLSLVTHFEYITSDNAGKSAYGMVPASMSLTTIDQNKVTGELMPTDLKKIDFSQVGGLWIPCNGSLTPWNTHLGSEEYDADARAYEEDPSKTFLTPFVQSYYQDQTKVGNPYQYGYITEVTVKADNSTKVAKHYSMGRFSHELGKVAPDQKTAFFGDDGGNTMLFMYIADKAGDLSQGTLYAAKWMQKSDTNGGSADLKWIKLGHAADSEIQKYLDNGTKFSDIFETADQDTAGFTKIKTYPSGKIEWLKVKPGMEKAAAFLEARRYGAILGATSEFNKMEGVAINDKDKKVYIAMSYMEKAMEKDSKGTDPTDDIQLKKIKAGVTYELALKAGQKDSSGSMINSTYVAATMAGLVVGEDLAKVDALGNKAAVDKVANPDNLAYSEKMRTLFIGEDSAMHVNNFLWAYNIDTKKLSRILSLPAGAESTGLQAVDNENGFSYIMSNLQHPGDEMLLPEPLKSEVDALINKNFDNKKSGVVGYISGIPSLNGEKQWTSSSSEMAALRKAAKAKGATVAWNQADRSVTVTKGNHTLTFKAGSKEVMVDGNTFMLKAGAKITNGRTMFPADLLAEFLK